MEISKNITGAQEFFISKSYEGYPSRNNPKYHAVSGWEDAVAYLDATEASWKRNGGAVVSRTESELVVEEGDGSMTITFEIR